MLKYMKAMKKIKLFIIILAVIVGIAGFYYYQKNIYSKEVLKLEILGPSEADAAQEIEYVVKYKNNGDTRLDDPQLVFEYPEYSIPIGESSLRITKTATDLGEAVYPGQEQTFSFKARLLGKEGDIKTAKAALSYRPKNLKAGYESSTTLTTVIKKVPITFEFDLPSKIASGKELTFRLNYYSNINFSIPDLRITVEYPTDFEYIDSLPKALDKTEWDIGSLNKASGGRIEISGKLKGDVDEEKVFQAKIGSWQNGEFILLKETTKEIIITKPSLYISQQINGSHGYVANPGDILHYEISFENVGEEMLSNLSLIVKLEGKAFDFETLKTPQGDFAAGDNSIVFDWKKVSQLQFLDAKEEGTVDFWINLKKEWDISGSQDKNPTIKDSVFLNQATEDFVNKVNSKLVILQKGYFEDEVFGNYGPLPPRVGEDTMYTIMWNVQNFYNDVSDVKVKARLPKNIELTGNIFPSELSSKFAFDSSSREIIWQVGDLKMSQGVANTPAPNISFQIKFAPSADQRGERPNIIGAAEITGQDQWTGATIEGTSPAVTTLLPDDKTITSEKTIVQ